MDSLPEDLIWGTKSDLPAVLNHLSSPFWCFVWTSADCLDHDYMISVYYIHKQNSCQFAQSSHTLALEHQAILPVKMNHGVLSELCCFPSCILSPIQTSQSFLYVVLHFPSLPFQARESLLDLSSSQTQLKRELAEGRDALEKMATLNEALAKDKRELSVRALQVWHAGLAHL